MGREPEDLEFQGLLLSHAHADHASYISHLREDLPIYCSDASYYILKAINDTSSGSFGDLTEFTKCFETYINRNGELSRKDARHEDMVLEREYNRFKFGEKFTIDNIEIEPFEVDHSLAGATGYIIHTSNGTIVYSGDFRFHGRREKETRSFMDACERAKPDVLISEGTRIADCSSKTESEVQDEICEITGNRRGLSICNWSVRDTDRMLSFLNAAKQMDKKLAVSLKQAYLLNELSNCSNTLAPRVDDENLAFYANRKSWGLIGSSCDQRLLNGDYDKWERDYLDKAICYKDIKADPSKYLMFCSNFDLKELIDIKPVSNSVYIKSVCEPFDQEMEMDWERVKNWLDHFGLSIESTHVSGHASGPQLKEFITTIKPKVLIPVHTENADAFTKYWNNIKLLKQVGNPIY